MDNYFNMTHTARVTAAAEMMAEAYTKDELIKMSAFEKVDWTNAMLPLATLYVQGQAEAVREAEKTPSFWENNVMDDYLLTNGYVPEKLENETVILGLGVKCHRCNNAESTTYYGKSKNYPSCEHCNNMLNDEFDREYQ